ncbi:MAG TPA: rubrerythrin family protein [Symbiobacteriaceae bacterium]|nr:rubrerythrin family protein [Symbiobacteriaceae bacterium]
MKNLQGTETLANLMKAFAGESQARNRYTFYASVAAGENLKQIEALFLETAENEAEHAKRFFNLMVEGLQGQTPAMVDVVAAYPVGIGHTLENLKAAAAGEHEEWTEAYPMFAEVAAKEGFPEVAAAFRMIARAEEAHERRYSKLVANLEAGAVFKKGDKVFWKCRNCGYIHEGTFAPKTCPACLFDQGYFEIFVESY